MKTFFLLLAVIVGVIVYDAYGIGPLVIVIFIFLALIIKTGNVKQTENPPTSSTNQPIDTYSEAIQMKSYQHEDGEQPIKKKRNRGTHHGFKYEDVIGHERLSGELLQPDLSEADPLGFFFCKNVVFTGKLYNYERLELAQILKQRGANINTSISKTTNVVILGNNPGPSKIDKIGQLLNQGYSIEIIDEGSLDNYL